MRNKRIFIIIAVVLLIVVTGIGYFVYGYKKVNSNTKVIAVKEEQEIENISVNEMIESIIADNTKIVELEDDKIEIEENEEQEETPLTTQSISQQEIETPIQRNKTKTQEIESESKQIPIQEDPISNTPKSIEVELDKSTRFDIDDDGYAGADALRLLFSDKVKPASASSQSSQQETTEQQ